MDRVVASTCWECSAYRGSVITVNVNAALSYEGVMDPVSGSVDAGAIPCRVGVA